MVTGGYLALANNTAEAIRSGAKLARLKSHGCRRTT
jgi:hypothetical protein